MLANAKPVNNFVLVYLININGTEFGFVLPKCGLRPPSFYWKFAEPIMAG